METTGFFSSLAQKFQRGSQEPILVEKATSEDQETLLEHGDGGGSTTGSKSSAWSTVTIVMPSLLLGLSLLTNPLLNPPSLGIREKDKLCNVQTSAYPSAVEDNLDIKWSVESANGSFEKQTIYRQPASAEVDQAWTDLGAFLPPLAIPEDRAEKYGLHPGQVKRIPEQGGGYIAILESTHQQHCLNLLRQGSHFDYSYYRAEALRTGKGPFVTRRTLLACTSVIAWICYGNG